VIYRLQGASLGAVLYIKLPLRITNEKENIRKCRQERKCKVGRKERTKEEEKKITIGTRLATWVDKKVSAKENQSEETFANKNCKLQ
jgi:hypothetical protein